MRDYYQTVLRKFVESENELDDYIVKNIIDVVRQLNYIDMIFNTTAITLD